MIDCNKAQELISCLIDGELGETDKNELLLHMETCPGCRAVYDAFSAVSDSLGELEAPPEELTQNVMQKIKLPEKQKTPWVKYLSLAACLALVIFAGAKLAGGNDASPTEECAGGDMAVANKCDAPAEEECYDATSDSCAFANLITRADGVSVPLGDDELKLLEADAELDATQEQKAAPDYTVTLEDGSVYEIFIDGDTAIISCDVNTYISASSAKDFEKLFE